MKKLLNISVIAALAILPLAANAEVVAGEPTSISDPGLSPAQEADSVTASGSPKYALAVSGTNDDKVATAGYVKGAYNSAIKAINKVSETASNALTASSTATLTNKTIDANGTGNSITNLETDNFASGVIVTEVGATGTDTALPTEQAVREAITTATTDMVTTTGTQTLTNKTISGGTVSGATITGGTIDADSTTISNLETDNFKSGIVVNSTTGIAATTEAASDSKLVTEKAIKAALTSATNGQVTETGTQTLTNKTIDADSNTLSNIELENLKGSAYVDSTEGIAAVTSASDTALVTEKAVATAIKDFATQTGAAATAAAAVNGATIDLSGLGVSTGNVGGTATIPAVATWGTDALAANPISVDLTQTSVVTGLTGNTANVANKISAGTVTYTAGQ